MNITKDTAVTLAYKLTTPQGKPLDAGTTAYLHGGYEIGRASCRERV